MKTSVRIVKEVKLVDVVSYLFIIGLLIVFLIQVQDRNKLEYLNAQLRLKNCNLPDESIIPIINDFVSGEYSVIDNIVKNGPEVNSG